MLLHRMFAQKKIYVYIGLFVELARERNHQSERSQVDFIKVAESHKFTS